MKKIFILGCFLFVRITISAQWLSNGTHIYNTNSGNVGIGTSSPANTLHIIGGLSAGDSKFYNSIQLTDAINGNTQSWIWTGATNQLSLGVGAVSSGNTKMLINSSGNVGIGTTSPSEKLSVNGNISTKKCIVTQIGWSDYVFNDDYKLRPLSEVAQYIKDNKRLPEVPSAKEVGEKGLSVGDNQALLLKKIEELTLYVLELKNENKEQSIKIKRLENQVRKNK